MELDFAIFAFWRAQSKQLPRQVCAEYVLLRVALLCGFELGGVGGLGGGGVCGGEGERLRGQTTQSVFAL